MLDLSSWPAGMRVIVRKERPHPGAQLRFTGLDGHRFTAFADHGAGRNGEPLTMVLRNGSAGSNTAADHIEASRWRWPSCPAGCGARCSSGPTPVAARTGSWSG